MAESTIARPRTPNSSTNAPRNAPTGAPAETPPDTATLLEETLAQLHSLLCYCHGNTSSPTEEAAPEHRNNVLWLACDLAGRAVDLFQKCAPREGWPPK